jgi:hypothetical protein
MLPNVTNTLSIQANLTGIINTLANFHINTFESFFRASTMLTDVTLL